MLSANGSVASFFCRVCGDTVPDDAEHVYRAGVNHQIIRHRGCAVTAQRLVAAKRTARRSRIVSTSYDGVAEELTAVLADRLGVPRPKVVALALEALARERHIDLSFIVAQHQLQRLLASFTPEKREALLLELLK